MASRPKTKPRTKPRAAPARSRTAPARARAGVRTFTAPSSAGTFVITWRNVTPFQDKGTHFASICLQIAGARFGAWTKKQATPDFVYPFCQALELGLKYCDTIPAPSRGELLSCPPLDMAEAMHLALRDRPLPRKRFPVCHAAHVAGAFKLKCLEIGHFIYDFPATDCFYIMADASVCRLIAARCTWDLDRCLIRRKTLIEAWVSRAEMERLCDEMMAFDATAASPR